VIEEAAPGVVTITEFEEMEFLGHLGNQKNNRPRPSHCGSGGRWFESTQLYQITT
jgi:hypothetical protein